MISLSVHEDNISEVTSRIAESVISRVEPKALKKFGMARVSDLALNPPDFLGPLDEGLSRASKILQVVGYAIREALSTHKREIIKASTLDKVLSIVQSEVKTQATRLRGPGDAQAIVQGLSDVIEEHPSHLDAITAAVAPQFQTEEEKSGEKLQKSVVQVINRSEGFMGSGFAIDTKGHILTAHHVVENAKQIKIAFDKVHNALNEGWNAHIVASLKEQDLSILELEDNSDAERAGLVPCRLGYTSPTKLRGHPLLGLGYHADAYANRNGILDPCPTLAHVVQQLPIRRVSFGDVEQPCLITVVKSGQEPISKGMSGGPFLDLTSDRVIAMITGAQATGVRQFIGIESLPVIEYGFGISFSLVRESWPEFAQYCPTGT